MLASVLTWTVVFVVTFFYDVICTLYLKKVHEGKAFLGAVYSSAAYLTSALVIIEYTSDRLLICPALIGGFLGTYFTIRYIKNK